jgi:hypothetical protein
VQPLSTQYPAAAFLCHLVGDAARIPHFVSENGGQEEPPIVILFTYYYRVYTIDGIKQLSFVKV